MSFVEMSFLLMHRQVEHPDNILFIRATIWIEPHASEDVLALIPPEYVVNRNQWAGEVGFLFDDMRKIWQLFGLESSTHYTTLLQVQPVLSFFSFDLI